MKDGLNVKAGTVVDASFMSVRALRAFLREQLAEAKQMGILFSVHLKATMMKVSDPIIFGHAVAILLEDFAEKHGAILDDLGIDYKLGLSDLEARIATLRGTTRRELEADLIACFEKNPPLYMVNSDKGLSNFHVSSDVIIDASMPALIRAGGKGWGPDGTAQDCKCVIPDNSYAPIYDETIKFFKENGSLDPKTAGSVPMLALWPKRLRNMDRIPQPFKWLVLELFVIFWLMVMFCMNITSKREISGVHRALTRHRLKIGFGWGSLARGRPEQKPSFG